MGASSVVIEEALARLTPEAALLDQAAQYLRRFAAFAQPVAVLHGAVEDVEAAEVEQVEWAHRPIESFLDRDVDVLRARVAALEQPHRLLRGGKEDPVDDEPPDLFFEENRGAVDAADEFHRGPHSVVRGLRAAYHLAQLHDRDRVEEMHVAAALGLPGDVG